MLVAQSKNVSVVPVLRFADNVLHNPTLIATAFSAAHSSLWEQEGRQALGGGEEAARLHGFISHLEWLLPDNCSHTPVLQPTPGHWVWPQHVLITPVGMPTVSPCSFRMKGTPVAT